MNGLGWVISNFMICERPLALFSRKMEFQLLSRKSYWNTHLRISPTRVYTNVDPVLRHAVDQIPAADWLRFCVVSKRRRNGQ